MKGTRAARVRLGAFELDLKAGELRLAAELEGENRIVLPDQPFRLLVMLVEREGTVVTREEIKKKFWPNDTIVEFDHSINVAIGKLRKALADSGDEPKYIETIPRRGYRLMVPVEWSGADDSSASPSEGDGGTAVRLQSQPGLIGAKVSHYRVLEVVGGGGMGMVYKAEDLKLGRHVALKFLPPELAGDPVALQRFEREARAASSLDHPNICTIHEVEEHDGQPFIVMQLLHGETLRDRLAALAAAQNRLPLDELLDIAIQICHGLEAAHAKGIIHRDIKPPNIFLTSAGQVKILDFGLAKLLVEAPDFSAATREPSSDLSSRAEPPSFGGGVEGPAFDLMRENAGPSTPYRPDPQQQRVGEEGGRSAQDDSSRVADGPAETAPRHPVTPADATLTRFGVAMGTAGYMSPEQVRGETLDARTDIFSFGLVLYEMVTGEQAFTGQTEAILHDAIVNREPTAVHELVPGISAKLEGIISKCLEKERERRYRNAPELRTELEDVKPAAQTNRPRKVIRRLRIPIAAIFACLAVAGGGLYWRSQHRPKLTDQDTVVLADLANKTSDPIFDDGLSYALRVALEQTPFLNLLGTDKVRGTLRLMNHPEDERLSGDTARIVCARTNSRALVTGSITDVGNHYRLALECADCQTGSTLARSEVDVKNRDEIVKNLGVAAALLRTRLGETASSVRRFNKPLDSATSSSLEALQEYAVGGKVLVKSGDKDAIPYFERAINFDPRFAFAYVVLGVAHGNVAKWDLGIRDRKRAYQLRHQLTERQRLYVEVEYQNGVMGDFNKAIDVSQEWIQIYPNDSTPHLSLGVMYNVTGEYEKGIAELQEARRFAPDSFQVVDLLVRNYFDVNRFRDAWDLLDWMEARSPDLASFRRDRYSAAFLMRDYQSMKDQIRWAGADASRRGVLLPEQAGSESYFGRLARGRDLSMQAVAIALNENDKDMAADYMADQALREAEVGEIKRARQTAEEAIRTFPGRDVRVVAAWALARSGDLSRAQELTQGVAKEFELNVGVQQYSVPTMQAAIQLRANPHRAIDLLRVTMRYDLAHTMGNLPNLYHVYLRGLAYLQAGEPQNAAVEFQKLIDHPGVLTDPVFIIGALAYLQLGRAQAMMGDKAAARKSYQDFLTIWKDADPDIPIYKQAKAEYAKLQ